MWAIAAYPAAVHEVLVVVSDATMAVAEWVRAPAVAAVHRAWEEAVVAAEAGVVEVVAAVAEVVVEVVLAAAAVVAAVVVAEGGNE